MNSYRAAGLLTLLLIALQIGLFGGDLGNPPIAGYDEFLTLDRTLNVLATGDPWNVYTNYRTDMLKPPLQFFLGAALIKIGIFPEIAVRLWSVFFAAGCLLLVAAFAYHLVPEKPWAAPTAVLLLSSSTIFAECTRQALLETGYTFFILLSVYSVFRAKDSPRYWLVWGLACGLGTLQKVPVALVLSLFLIIALYRKQRVWKDRWFAAGVVLNVLLTGFWPLVQTIQHGATYKNYPVSRWVFRLTTGVDWDEGKGFQFSFNWLKWFSLDSRALWSVTLCVLAIAVLRSDLRRSRLWWLFLPAVVVMFFFTTGAGPFYPRYLLTFTPLAIVVVTVFLSRLSPRSYIPPLLATVVFFCGGARLAQAPYLHADSNLFDLALAKHRLTRILGDDVKPIFYIYHEPKLAGCDPLAFKQPVDIRFGGSSPNYPGKYVAVARHELLPKISKNWPGSIIEVERVGRYLVLRLE